MGLNFGLQKEKDITVGEGYMFVKNIKLITGDTHAIFQNGKRLNKGGSISISNHVWIGANAKIMKGIVMLFGIYYWQCIIGYQSARRRKCYICRNSNEVD